MITQADKKRLQEKMQSIPIPRCSRCHASVFITQGDKTWCGVCGRVWDKCDQCGGPHDYDVCADCVDNG